MPTESKDYRDMVNSYIQENFDTETKKNAFKAVDDYFAENGDDYRWIYNALTKKSALQYQKFGFGLWWSPSFRNQVDEKIKRLNDNAINYSEDTYI